MPNVRQSRSRLVSQQPVQRPICVCTLWRDRPPRALVHYLRSYRPVCLWSRARSRQAHALRSIDPPRAGSIVGDESMSRDLPGFLGSRVRPPARPLGAGTVTFTEYGCVPTALPLGASRRFIVAFNCCWSASTSRIVVIHLPVLKRLLEFRELMSRNPRVEI